MSWQAIVKLNLIQHSTQMSDILYLPISNLILKIFILLPFYLFKHGHFPDSFLFIFVFSNITILYRKLLWKVTTNHESDLITSRPGLLPSYLFYGPRPTSFSFIFIFYNISIFTKSMCENVHPVYSVLIRTNDLQNMSLLP